MVKLPERFNEFADARKEGFLAMKAMKEEGKKVVGVYCAFTPKELIMAAGAVPVGLCGTSEEPVAAAERDLPRNLCPLIKSSYGFAVTDTCPYFYFSDLLVGETTCDGKKKMYEYLGEIKPMHIMELPQRSEGRAAFDLWRSEIVLLKERLEKELHTVITESALREAIRKNNEYRQAMMAFCSLSKNSPPPMSGLEMNQVLFGAEFKFDKLAQIEEIQLLTEKIRTEYAQIGSRIPKEAKRILVTGCPIGGAADKVIRTIEENGGVVVCYENCGGAKSMSRMVDEEIDPIDALTEKYLAIACSVMTPNDGRMKLIEELIQEYQIQGVVDVVLQACHTYNIETTQVKERVFGQLNLPYISIETDYSQADLGQLSTRMGAFIEML